MAKAYEIFQSLIEPLQQMNQSFCRMSFQPVTPRFPGAFGSSNPATAAAPACVS